MTTRKQMSAETKAAIDAAREAKKQNKSDTAITLSYRSKKWIIRQSDSDNWELIEQSIVDGKEVSSSPAYYPSKVYCLQIALTKMVDCTVSQTVEGLVKEFEEIKKEIREALR